MKNFTFIMVLIFLGLSNATGVAQGSWTLQTNPSTSEGESIQFVSATEGWIGLNSGQLLHTTNAGQTWNVISPTDDMVGGMDAPGSRISFINASTGWVMKSSADDNGNFLGTNLYKTVNGGANWSRTVLSNTVGDAGIQVQFVDANNGWVLIFNMNSGTPIFKRTTDGGTTWTPTNGRGIFHYVNTSVGYSFTASPEGNPPFTIYKTTDGGSTWTSQHTDYTPGSLEAIQFIDENNGWIVGANGKILKTNNGGTNWIPITNALPNADFENSDLSFISSTTGWIATRANADGSSPIMLKTSDGGNSWTTESLPLGNRVFSMDFWDANNGWATSASYNINGIDYPSQIAKYGAVNTYPSIGIVGDATLGWETDIAMNTTDGNTYKITAYTFKNGGAKFRQDNTWAINWGSNAFPSGTGTQNGPNIPVIAGKYDVTFNRLTGDYAFSTGNYSNTTLNGPWFVYANLNPINPYNDNLLYLVFDGNGVITDISGFGGPWTGIYNVSPSGIISGTATNGSESFPISGQLTSSTEGTAIIDNQNWKLHKIANPGALKDKIEGTLSTATLTANCGSRNVTLNIDSNGNITSADGLMGPVVGRVYSDLGVYIGHMTTGEGVHWSELTINGFYSNNSLVGQLGLDDDSQNPECINGTSNLVRSDNQPINSDWKLQTNPVTTTASVGKIQFVTATEGWISISLGGLLHTTNGGTTWTEVPLDLPGVVLSSMTDPAFNMCFINPLTGWVLKSFGSDPFDSNGAVVYKTTNGGLNWQKIILSQVPKDMGGQIQFIDENNGYASIVNTGSVLGKYYKTTDGGTTWSILPSDGTVGIFYSVDLNNAWGILGTFSQTPPFKILHSNNGMASFTEQYTDDSPGAFWAIQFTDLNHGWVVGQNGKILKTTDGGVYWDTITNAGITSDYTCKSVYFINATTGWIGAQIDNSSNKITTTNYAIVLHTTDGGASWTTQSTPTFNPYSIFFWDENKGWFTSDDNKIANYTGALAVKENVVHKFITIYPNPNNGTFYFSLKDTNSKVKAEIFTLSGQKVYEASNFEMQPQNEINFAPQAKGIYLIKITDGENSYTGKMMIQ